MSGNTTTTMDEGSDGKATRTEPLCGNVVTVARQARLLAKKCREARGVTNLESPASSRLLHMLSHTAKGTTPPVLAAPRSAQQQQQQRPRTHSLQSTASASDEHPASPLQSQQPQQPLQSQRQQYKQHSEQDQDQEQHQAQQQQPEEDGVRGGGGAHQLHGDSEPSAAARVNAQEPQRPSKPRSRGESDSDASQSLPEQQRAAIDLLVWMATTLPTAHVTSEQHLDQPAESMELPSETEAAQGAQGHPQQGVQEKEQLTLPWECDFAQQARQVGRFISRVFHLRYGPLNKAFPDTTHSSSAATAAVAAAVGGGNANIADFASTPQPLARTTGRPSPSPQSPLTADNLQSLSAALSTIIDWLTTLPLTNLTVSAMYLALKEARGEPSVRRHVVAAVLDWIASQPQHSITCPDAHQAVEACLVLGLTDVWSAIRKAAALRLADVLTVLTTGQTQQLFNTLAATCLREDAVWQETEGAVQGITAIIRKFTWVHRTTLEHAKSSGRPPLRFVMAADALTDRTDYQLTFGDTVLPAGLPSYVVNGFHGIVYKLLAHEQLSIRECATKAYAAFLSRSQFHEALQTLEHIVSRLRRDRVKPPGAAAAACANTDALLAGTRTREAGIVGKGSAGQGDGNSSSSSSSSSRLAFTSSRLHRQKEEENNKKNKEEKSTGHPGLSEIQRTSSPSLLPRPRSGDGWGRPFAPLPAHEAEGLLGVCHFIIKHVPPGFLLPKWPLFFSTFSAYLAHPASTVRQATSTVFKFVVAKDSSNPIMLKLVLQGLCANWPIDTEALASEGGTDEVQRDGSPPWQWKEGRLLAYELILRYCITNHVHYLFPTLLLDTPYKPRQGVEQTTDPHQSHIPKRKFRRLLSIPSSSSLLSRRGHGRSASHHALHMTDALPHFSFKSDSGGSLSNSLTHRGLYHTFHHGLHAVDAGPVTPYTHGVQARNARSTSHRPAKDGRIRAATGAPTIDFAALESPRPQPGDTTPRQQHQHQHQHQQQSPERPPADASVYRRYERIRTPPLRSSQQGSVDDHHLLLSPAVIAASPATPRSVSNSPNTTRKELSRTSRRLGAQREAGGMASPRTGQHAPATSTPAVGATAPATTMGSTTASTISGGRASDKRVVSLGVRTPGRRLTSRKMRLCDHSPGYVASTPLKFDTYQQIRVHRLTRTLSAVPSNTVTHSGSLLSHLSNLDLLDAAAGPTPIRSTAPATTASPFGATAAPAPSSSSLHARLSRSPLWGVATRTCRQTTARLARQLPHPPHADVGNGGEEDTGGVGVDSGDDVHNSEGAGIVQGDDSSLLGAGERHELSFAAPAPAPRRKRAPPSPVRAAVATAVRRGRASRSRAAAAIRNPLSPPQDEEATTPSPRRVSRSKSFSARPTATDLRVVGQVVDQTPHEGEMPSWADTSRFEPLSLVLVAMALQVTESFASPQFELRRMATAVLPLLTEVMRWFDPATLHDLWLAFTPQDASWAAHVAALAFKQSLAHAAWLRSFTDSQALASSTAACRRACHQMISFVEPHVSWLLPAYVQRGCTYARIDATMVVCLDVCCLACISFRHCLRRPSDVELSLVSRLLHLGTRAYPNSALLSKAMRRLRTASTATNAAGGGDNADAEEEVIDRRAFLRHIGSVREVPDAVVLKLALKQTIEQLHSSLSDFADVCSLEAAMFLLPLLTRIVPLVQNDEDIAKNILEAMHRSIDRLGYAHWFAIESTDTETWAPQPDAGSDETKQEQREGEEKQWQRQRQQQQFMSSVTIVDVDASINRCKTPSAKRPPDQLQDMFLTLAAPAAFQCFLNVIQAEDCDTTLLRRVLDVVRTLFVATAATPFLKRFLGALAAKLRANQPAAPAPVHEPTHLDVITGTTSLDLSIHSNEDSDDENSAGQSLEHSGRGFAPATGAAAVDDDNDDWDSWEEDEQGDAAVVQAVCEYITHFKSIFSSPRMKKRVAWYRDNIDARAYSFDGVFKTLSLEDQATIAGAVTSAELGGDGVEIHSSSEGSMQHSFSSDRLYTPSEPRHARVSIV